MNGILTEFENENSLRNYPFAEFCRPVDEDGAEIGTGIFIDAVLYPINSSGSIYLSGLSKDGVVSISDDTGVIMTASLVADSDHLEFYEVSGLKRHVGTLLSPSAESLAAFVNGGLARSFTATATTFSASCVFPLVVDGITSLAVGETGTVDQSISFENAASDTIRVSTGTRKDGRQTLRFDVIPPVKPSVLTSIQHIICVVDGKTPFRIRRFPENGNTVELYFNGIGKEEVCADAHKEDAYQQANTCPCQDSSDSSSSPRVIPETYQATVVDIPFKADGAFYLVVPNSLGYANPLSITLTDGETVPKLTGVTTTVSGGSASINADQFSDNVTSKGAIIQVPGLKGGQA